MLRKKLKSKSALSPYMLCTDNELILSIWLHSNGPVSANLIYMAISSSQIINYVTTDKNRLIL